MVKEKKSPKRKKQILPLLLSLPFIGFIIFLTFSTAFIYSFEKKYQHKIYPGVRIDGIFFGGKAAQDAEKYFLDRSQPFDKLQLTLNYEDKIATISGIDLKIAFDGKLSGIQAYSIGRSGNFLSDIYQKWKAATVGINLSSVLKMNTSLIDENLAVLAQGINIPSQDALFQFENGKVTLFRVSKTGRKLNQVQTKQVIHSLITAVTRQESLDLSPINIPLQVDTIFPKITTENSNNLGIKELLGSGTSKFVGSIPGRVHNIELAASRLNGKLIPAGSTFSFNDELGDVSANTGFQQAYIIKEGRTILGDGGGVCQVSTTLFRAALNAGLQIEERHAHAYRVSYYEQDSPPGLDATVFAPSVDLKFKNDTENYILIQSKTDTQNHTLTFELFGTSDGRKAEITKPIIFSQTPPPPDLYQDDPTLPKGTVKQVDWQAWGAKVNFDYKVTRGNEVLFQKSFFSNYQPWQAVYLRGTKE